MSIGAALAEAREEAGLTVADVSGATCIRESIIGAIEADDFSTCGGHFYVRGHIRSIAKVVGTDAEPLITRYDEEHGGPPRATSARPAEPPDRAPVRVGRLNWSIALAVVLLLVVIGYGAFRLFGGTPSTDAAANPSNVPAGGSPMGTTAAGDESREKAAGQRRDRGGDRRRGPSRPPPAPERVQLTMSFDAKTWVSASDSEGHTIFAGLLFPGDVVRWSDAKMITVDIGNAGGVSLTVNGKDFGAVGKPGKVVHLTIYPDRIARS